MGMMRKATRWLARNLGLENPALSRYLTRGAESYAGKTVTPETALNLSTVYRCDRLTSESLAMLPAKIYTRDRRGEARADTDHWLYPLLHDSPNRDQTAYEFWESVGMALAMWGNSYNLKEYQGDRLIALTPVRPDSAVPYREPGGRVRYKIVVDGVRDDVPQDRMFHIRGWGGGFNLVGASPIGLARHGLGLAMAVEEAASRFFANGLRPSGFVATDQGLKPDQRERLKLNLQEFQGSHNAGKIMLLEHGLSYEQLTLPPEDAQMLETRGFHVQEICRWFGVPPYLAFDTEKSTSWGTGLEQQQIGYLIFTLMPYLERIEQAINKWLLRPEERLMSYAEFSVEGILRADSASRSEFYQKLVLAGIFTPDEVRALEGRPAMGGNAGKLWMPMNQTPIDQARGPAAQTAPQEGRA
jgi:HK97 family phage portal protein